jgi:hypothetical protein
VPCPAIKTTVAGPTAATTNHLKLITKSVLFVLIPPVHIATLLLIILAHLTVLILFVLFIPVWFPRRIIARSILPIFPRTKGTRRPRTTPTTHIRTKGSKGQRPRVGAGKIEAV